jgi:hypothetical protein
MLSYYVTAQVIKNGAKLVGRQIDREDPVSNIEDVHAIEHVLADLYEVSFHDVTVLDWKRFESPQH